MHACPLAAEAANLQEIEPLPKLKNLHIAALLEEILVQAVEVAVVLDDLLSVRDAIGGDGCVAGLQQVVLHLNQ